jgi:DNA-binding GntR family transcriptional regulator
MISEVTSMWSAATDSVGSGNGLQVPTSYTDQIASLLEQEILRGKFRRGEHLQQDEICKRFGVSRTPAREALRKLQALGLVVLVPNKGARIQRPTLAELRETYEVRAELEGFAAALACEARTDELVERLSAAQQRLRSAVAIAKESPADAQPGSLSSEQLKVFNDEFHQLIHAGAQNSRLSGVIHDLERYFPKDTVRKAISLAADLQRFYVDEHDVIHEEMINGRAEGARDAMRAHIHAAQNLLLNYLCDLGYDD